MSEDPLAFLAGTGVTGELVRSIDWAKTPLGPAERWPVSLKTTLSTVFYSRHPMFLTWGPEHIQFYNDAYLPSFGRGKHPAAMGQSGPEFWMEIWPIISPQIDDVLHFKKPSWHEDQLVPVYRNGRQEEVYWTYGYSAVLQENGEVGGVLVVCTETTTRVLSERRSRCLAALGELAWVARDPESLAQEVAQELGRFPADVPLALIYLQGPSGPRLVASTLQAPGVATRVGEAFRRALEVSGAFGPAVERGRETHPPGCCRVPDAAWAALCTAGVQVAHEAFVVPLLSVTPSGAPGCIVFGLSPRLLFDEAYREFLGQITKQFASAEDRIQSLRVRAVAEAERNNLIMQAPVATALLSGPEHVFLLANPMYQQVVGRQELVGKRYVEAFPDLADSEIPSILDRVYRTGQPFVTDEYLVPFDRNGDGKLEDSFFKFSFEPLRGAEGRVYGMMSVAVDITEQVRARRVLERAHADREKLLAELEAANNAKDEFLAMLGHELRNPLSPIVSALELMKLRSGGCTTREQSIIERQVSHLVRLVDDLLDVSKITRGKVELKRERLDICDILDKAIEISSLLFEQKNHHLSIEAPEHLPSEGDPVRLAQVVANLLTNAARYTPPGGHIRLRAARDAEAITISVEDDGIGISAELLPRIFDVFVQGRRSADRAEGGLGIGLALVRSLVALHGGTVSAESEGPGRGSRFTIRLPSACEPSTVPASARDGARPSNKSARLLVVDDNVDAADSLAQVLGALGHDVTVAYDPLTALGLFGQLRPRVAILDIGLPMLDGFELARRVRAVPGMEGCGLIALTGYGQPVDRSRSEAAGFDRHLVKPVDVDQLLEAIDTLTVRQG